MTKNKGKSTTHVKSSLYQASPFSTGGGGTRFEYLVGTTFLVSLITMEIPRGLDQGITQKVKFQTRYKGNHLDDIEVISSDHTHEYRLYLQVKHRMSFTKQDLEFQRVLGDCWNDYSKESFNKNIDRIGIALQRFSSVKTSAAIYNLLAVARTSADVQEFIKKILTKGMFSTGLKKYFLLFQDVISSSINSKVSKEYIWEFLKHLVVLEYDFDNPGSRDSVYSWNSLLKVLAVRDPFKAKSLFDSLYRMVGEYSATAGTISIEEIQSQLPKNLLLATPSMFTSDLRRIREFLSIQTKNQIKRQVSKKKYIPAVFTEIGDIKETTRVFTDPALFWDKIIYDIGRINFNFLNDFLAKIGLPLFKPNMPPGFCTPLLINEVDNRSRELGAYLNSMGADLERHTAGNIRHKVPEDKLFFFEQNTHRFDSLWTYKRRLERVSKLVEVLGKKIIIITDRAGQGKTNFVCDLAENVLLKKSQLCIFLTGSEFNFYDLNKIGNSIISEIFGQSSTIGFDDFMLAVSSICEKDNTTFTIIIDGINEHYDIQTFSHCLELFLEEISRFSFVRIILTCRTEYFEQRFTNLLCSSFSDIILQLNQVNSMEEKQKERLYESYMNFFKLKPLNISQEAYQSLCSDPLLLRVFCEAYGNPEAVTIERIPEVYDIYRESLFRKYIEMKIQEMESKQHNNNLVGGSIDLKRTLYRITSYMVKNARFSLIPVEQIVDDCDVRALSKIVDEDILFRIDPKESASNFFSYSSEVLSFTFDELRDFLLADYIVANVGVSDFHKLVEAYTKPEVQVAEGLSRYLIYITIRQHNSAIMTILEKFNWFEKQFIKCVFSIEDAYISDDELTRLKKLFRNEHYSKRMIVSCIRRFNTDKFKNLNINLLFDLMQEISEEEYNKYFLPVFNSFFNRYYMNHSVWSIKSLVGDLEEILDDLTPADQRHNLFELLLFLIEARYDYSRYWRAQSLFSDYCQKYPEQALRVLLKYKDIPNRLVAQHAMGFIIKNKSES